MHPPLDGLETSCESGSGRSVAGASGAAPGSFYVALTLAAALTFLAAGRTTWAQPMELFQALLALAGIAWILAVRLAAQGRGELRAALAAAVAVRLGILVLGTLTTGPNLSDDVQRYAWEGRVVAQGVSPYAYAPDDPHLEGLRAEFPELAASVGHASIPAVYPPAAQYWHAGVMSAASLLGFELGNSVLPLRWAYGLLDLVIILPLLGLLRRRGLPDALVVAWGSCPLVLLSYAGTGHVDALAILGLVLALHAFDRPGRCGAWLGLGVAAKYLPLIALPALWLRSDRRGRLTLGLGVACALLFLPIWALDGGERGVAGGLTTYGTSWQGGSLVFRWVDEAVRGWEGLESDPRLVARRILAAAWLLLAAWSTLRRRDPVHAVGGTVGAYLVLSPTLHPWYLTWVLPFVALRPRLSWLVLSVCAPLLWWPVEDWQERGEWVEPSFVWPLLALPFFTLRLLELRRGPHS